MTSALIPSMIRYGGHRVLEPKGALPQAAQRLRDDPELPDEEGGAFELVLDVERLNVDSASFRQLEEEAAAAGEEPAAGVARRVLQIVAARGKLHNPVTGSGGMLLGRVRRVGRGLPPPHSTLQPGERIATLVSLTLTPLRIERIHGVHTHMHQIDVTGTAVLFASAAWSRLPAFLPEGAALAALDVAGAAPQVERLCGPGSTSVLSVLILGCGGKSGLLCAAAARRAGARVIGVERDEAAAQAARRLGACAQVLLADATDPLALAQTVGGEHDVVVSCVNVPGAEMAAILCTREGGVIYFFSMATSFTRAALGAEGVSRDVQMLIGNGYCQGHAEATFRLLEEDERLRELFIERYG